MIREVLGVIGQLLHIRDAVLYQKKKKKRGN